MVIARAFPTRPHCSDEEPGESSCPQNVQLKWATEVLSSIYATPIITDLYSDAHKDIIVPGFVNQLEVSLFHTLLGLLERGPWRCLVVRR